MSEPLNHLANRVAADPLFLANALAEYARSEGLDDNGLAAALGCRLEDLTPLRLCRTPRPETADFRSDVAAIATRFGIDPATLAEVTRRGQGLAKLRTATRSTAADPGFLLAARDDDRPPSPPPAQGPPP